MLAVRDWMVPLQRSTGLQGPDTMSRNSYDHIDCSIAQALDVIGDRWTLLVIRNAFHGMRTFDAFSDQLGLSSSVLADRLKKLTDNGVLERRSSPEDGRSVEYRLTPKGFDLYPMLVAMIDWGEKHIPNGRGVRIKLHEKSTGKPVKRVAVLAHDGRPLKAWDVEVRPGPGADKKTRMLIEY